MVFDIIKKALVFLGSRKQLDDIGHSNEWDLLIRGTEAEAKLLESRIFGAERRLFDGKENADVILWRDKAGWCPFSQSAQMLLEEMKVSYEIKTIPLRAYMRAGEEKDPAYIKDVPDGVVPGLQHFDKEKNCWKPAFRNVYAIYHDLQMHYPEAYPMGDADIHQEVCGPEGLVGQLERAPYRTQPKTAAKILRRIDELIQRSGGPFVCGKELTAADLQLIPLLERYEAYILFFYGQTCLDSVCPFDRLGNMLHAARDQSQAVHDLSSDQHTLARIALHYDPEGSPRSENADAIEKPKRTFTCSDARIAAAKLARNHGPVAKFALRLATKQCEQQQEDVVKAIDFALLQIATTLLHDGTSSPSFLPQSFKYPLSIKQYTADAISMLALHVGVPRDFWPGPADALRAYCSDFAHALLLSDNEKNKPPPVPSYPSAAAESSSTVISV